ncbi:MAG: hypothetical protein KAY32_14345 [Candidatus Eisenbacteria sp.]|nr:hypothetical protein [Candidatus Eisenbacteria bacterium]
MIGPEKNALTPHEVEIDIEVVSAPLEAIAAALGPGGIAGARSAGRWAGLVEEARRLFRRHAAPRGLLAEISTDQFAALYQGDGHNAPETPLGEIFPRAAHLALFAATIGAGVHRALDELFAGHEFPLAILLDAAASEGADRAGEAVARHYREQLEARRIEAGESPGGRDAGVRDAGVRDTVVRDAGVRDAVARGGPGTPVPLACLRYSPGYCGWNISGQRALFAALKPERIGITLRPSMLMEPLKSVSGVVVGGRPEIHRFADRYPFCADCRTHGCRERIRKVLESGSGGRA